MTITNTNPTGVRIDSQAKNGTLGSQAAAAADEIIFDTTIATNNGNLEAGPTFVGRLVIVRRDASDEETRYITAIDGGGTVATVNEAWIVAPTSGDTYDVAYRLTDAETTGASVTLNSKTGLYEFSRSLVVGTPGGGGAFAYFQITDYDAMESDDSGSTDDVTVEDNGRFEIGYLQAGAPLAGGVITNTKNTDTEPYLLLNGGAIVRWYTPILWSQVSDTSVTMVVDDTSDIEIQGATFIKTSSSAVFAKCTLTDVIWQGSG